LFFVGNFIGSSWGFPPYVLHCPKMPATISWDHHHYFFSSLNPCAPFFIKFFFINKENYHYTSSSTALCPIEHLLIILLFKNPSTNNVYHRLNSYKSLQEKHEIETSFKDEK